ncbi:hypothetical protein Tco_0767905 [Tanacetum coccineum]
MESQSETTQTVSALKLLVLETGDYDLWSMRMEQYLTHTNYALWEVIVNGDAPAVTSASSKGPIPPKTAEQKLARKNELKAKSTMLLAILDEHLLKFHGIKDAKTLWEAIKARFQKLISQLEIHGEVISQEDVDLKFSSSNTQNVAFVSSENTSSTNEAVNTAHELDNEDLEQIDTDDLEEIDLKWQVAMLTIRVKRFLKKTGRNLNFNGKETVGFDKTKVECYNYHKIGQFARECRAPRNHGNRNRDASGRIVPVETLVNALVVQDGIGGYDWSYQAEEGPTDFTLMSHLSLGSSSSSSSNTKLTKLINSQISVNNKSGFGFDSQMNDNELHNCHLNKSASDSSVNEIEEENNQVNDRFKKVEGYHTVPLPTLGTTCPQDLTYPLPSDPIIEEWESDSDDDYVIRPSFEQNKPTKNLRKSQSPRVDKRNWDGIMTQKLGNGFEFNKKACFVCGSLNHLIKDCNFYKNKMVGKYVLNNMGRVTGQREARLVWNNAQRVNHQNKMTHPHPKRNFVSTALATKFGLVPFNVAKQSSPRAAASISTNRNVNTATSKPRVNAASPTKYSYFKTHSPLRRPFNQKSAVKTVRNYVFLT